MSAAGIAIIDRHEACRAALAAAILRHGRGLRIVASAPRVDEALGNPSLRDAGAILLDAKQADESGSILAIRGRVPNARIVVVSAWIDGRSVVGALRAGALGYMPEWAEPDEILDAIAVVIAGRPAVHPDAAINGLTWAIERMDDAASMPAPLARLTPRERRVMDLLEEGMSPGEIATRLFLSKRTIQSHLQGAYNKLDVHGRVEAVWEYKRLRGDAGAHVS